MTTPTEPTPQARWTPDQWINEAIYQYMLSQDLMSDWKSRIIGSAAEIMTYKQADNCAQCATAAAAIATAKMLYSDMANS